MSVTLRLQRAPARAADAALAAAVIALGQAEVWLNASIDPKPAAALCEFALGLALASRRRFPLATVTAVAVAASAEAIAGVPLQEPLVPLIASVVAIYSLVTHAPRERAFAGVAIGLTGVAVQTASQHKGIGNFVFALVFLVGAWIAGRTIHARTGRAEQLEREQEQVAAAAAEQERRRIARELHDDFSQKLAAHAIALSNFRQIVVAGDSSVLERLEMLQDEAVSLSDDLRVVAHELHPPRLERAGLESALRSFCDEFSALTHLKIDLNLEVERTLPADVALCCFRVIQESLRNIGKHARALQVQLYIHEVDARVVLLVADDGVGIEEQKLEVAGGLGIISMAERIELLSGKFHIGRRKTGGTLIAVEIPIT
jgi:signal transduction histidine kinase